jgi:hypothetical protein
MITGSMVTAAPIGYPFCGAARYFMEYIIEKGHDVLTIDRMRNTNTKQISSAARTEGAASGEILVSLMLRIIWLIHIFEDTCRDIIHTVVE